MYFKYRITSHFQFIEILHCVTNFSDTTLCRIMVLHLSDLLMTLMLMNCRIVKSNFMMSQQCYQTFIRIDFIRLSKKFIFMLCLIVIDPYNWFWTQTFNRNSPYKRPQRHLRGFSRGFMRTFEGAKWQYVSILVLILHFLFIEFTDIRYWYLSLMINNLLSSINSRPMFHKNLGF